jgi:ubiquinone/menaquinone biosynthesis C-methylase UbiE
MESLPFEDSSFDLVVHTDTLEHVENPGKGLSECHRVLKIGGYCVFTVPIIINRLTISRQNLPPSYHGSEKISEYRVWTEFGSDIWQYVIQAGFQECRIISLEYPTAQAIVAVK